MRTSTSYPRVDKIAVVGASGLVGKEFARHFSTEHQVLRLTHSDLDITDAEAVRRLIFAERPALIVNCAVFGVDACELEPSLAWSVNVKGAENLAKAAAAIDAEFLQISSNYVFDGRRAHNSFYRLADFPKPINVYGSTKLAGERAVSAASQRCFIVRTSWVFGIGKDNFFSTAHRSLKAAKRIQAIVDIWANSTYVRDLVARVDEILMSHHYSTYHVTNSGVCSHHDFALEAARVLEVPLEAIRYLIEPVKASEIHQVAQRPRFTPMHCTVSEDIGLTPMRDWRASLADYIRSDSS